MRPGRLLGEGTCVPRSSWGGGSWWHHLSCCRHPRHRGQGQPLPDPQGYSQRHSAPGTAPPNPPPLHSHVAWTGKVWSSYRPWFSLPGLKGSLRIPPLLIPGGGLALKIRCHRATQSGWDSPPSCYELTAPSESRTPVFLPLPQMVLISPVPFLPTIALPVTGWNLSWLPLSLGLSGWPEENPPLPTEWNSIRPTAPSRHTFTISHFIFLDVISVPLNMSSLCVPSPHASHFPGVGASPSGGGPGGCVEALGGGDDRVSPSPAVQVGWGCFGWCSLCCASPVGEVAECGVSR